MKILVLGASGFVGRRLALALLSAGHEVRCLARTPAKVQNLAAVGCEVVQGDMADTASVERAMDSVQATYISVHTLSPQPAAAAGQGFMDVEKQGLRNIVTAGRARGVRRLISLTALGGTPDAHSAWSRERYQAEEELLGSGLDVTVLQPGQIVGLGGTGFDLLLSQARRSPTVMFSNGGQKWRPIAVDDLVYYLVGVLDDPRTYGQRYEVGSDDVLTNDQMVDLAAELLGRRHPLKLHVPRALMGALAPIIERLGKLPRGSVSGFVSSMAQDMVGNPAPLRELLPRPLLSYRQAVERSIAPTRP